MSKRTLVRAFLLMAVTSTLAACSDVVTAPEDDAKAGDVLLVNDVAFAKGGKGSGGGKPEPDEGGGGKAAPNRVSFSGDILLKGIDSDNGSPLVDGTDKVSVSISDRLDFTTFNGNQKQEDRDAVRTLCVDLGDTDVIHPVFWDSLNAVALSKAVSMDPLCVRARVHTRGESKGVTSLEPGETATGPEARSCSRASTWSGARGSGGSSSIRSTSETSRTSRL